jgi:hypothetical protein
MRLLLLAALLAATGCPRGGAAPGPESALRAYREAVARGTLDQAYALLSSEYKRTHDRAAWERSLGAADKKTFAERLGPTKVRLEATVTLADGETLELVEEGGAWRFARDPLDFYPQRSPEEALRSFVRAVDNRRYDVLVRFSTTRYRATVTPAMVKERWEGPARDELVAQIEALRAHLGEPLQLNAARNNASLVVGERKEARLVLEDGLWRVESLQ